MADGIIPKYRRGEIIVRDGKVLRFIEEELEGEKWEVLGVLAAAPSPPAHSDDGLLAKEFQPCVVVMDDPKRTEMVLRDCATVWSQPQGVEVDLGHDMKTGELIAIRVYGDVSKWPTTDKADAT